VTAKRFDFDLPVLSWVGCESMSWLCGLGKKDDNEKKWEVLMTI
jgi:hypothetical protein